MTKEGSKRVHRIERMKVCIAGVGGLGSVLVDNIVESIGAEIDEVHIIDIDTVERVNISTQMYEESDIGMSKAQATQKRIEKKATEKGYRVEVYGHKADVNKPKDIAAEMRERIAQCNVYISAMDNYASRVSYYYYIVQESVQSNKLYIDGGTEKHTGHCFYIRYSKDTTQTQPCMYCIRWMYPSEKMMGSLCGIRNIPAKITEETKWSVIAAMVQRVREEADTRDMCSIVHSEGARCTVCYTNIHQQVADKFNAMYNASGYSVSVEEIEASETEVLPTVLATSTIVSSIIVLKILMRNDNRLSTHNFILYCGDSTPVFHQHSIVRDAKCFLCSK